MSSPTVFIHIPKCGGNSIETKLRFNRIPFTRVEPELPGKNMPLSALVTGHVTYDQFAWMGEITFFTVMRDPLWRAVSHYFYNLKIKDQGPEYAKMKDMSLADYLMEHNNTMCIQMFGSAIFDNNYSNEKLYRLCIEIMRSRYLFAGNTDNLDYVDTWLAKIFGCRPFKAHENRNTYTTILPEKVKEDFMARNTVDYMVYRHIGSYWENPDLTPVYGGSNRQKLLKH